MFIYSEKKFVSKLPDPFEVFPNMENIKFKISDKDSTSKGLVSVSAALDIADHEYGLRFMFEGGIVVFVQDWTLEELMTRFPPTFGFWRHKLGSPVDNEYDVKFDPIFAKKAAKNNDL